MNILQTKTVILAEVSKLKKDLLAKIESEKKWKGLAQKASKRIEELEKQVEGYDFNGVITLQTNHDKLVEDYEALRDLHKNTLKQNRSMSTELYKSRTNKKSIWQIILGG